MENVKDIVTRLSWGEISPEEAITGINNLINLKDSHLEKINDIMWESYMIKDHVFSREDGKQIMKALDVWASE